MRRTERLTPAEQRVAARILRGDSDREAAEALGVRVTTVCFHLQAIAQKLGLPSARRSLIILALSGRPFYEDAKPKRIRSRGE